MACGIPVVATNAGGTRELISNGKSGFICNIEDRDCMLRRVLELLNCKKHRKTFARNGIQRIKNQFTLKKLINNFKSLIIG